MRHLRYLVRPLVVVAVIATALSLAASPATAQEFKVFTFVSIEPDDSNWEIRVSVESFGGCGVSQGYGGGDSEWLQPDDEWGEVLNLACSYTITAKARNGDDYPGKLCEGVLGWGTETPTEDKLRTRDANRGEQTQVRMQHADPVSCDAAIVATFSIDSAKVVERLPVSAFEGALQARAERAVEVTDFEVRVGPHQSTRSRSGCNQVLFFDVSGGLDGEVEKGLPGIAVGRSCKFVVTIEHAPPPFQVTNVNGVIFDTGGSGSNGLIDIDLTNLLTMPYGRIAIIQDTTGSDNRGFVSYRISRSCAGVGSLPPLIQAGGGPGIFTLPGGQVVATLSEGRFTVHSANFANFGPGANYLAVARSATGSAVDGCAVTVIIEDVPDNCTARPSVIQSLTWRSSAPFEHFDFEFDISCGAPGSAIASDLPPPPPPSGSSSRPSSSGDSAGAVATASADVRIIAKKLSSGAIEFGLEQQLHDGTWGGRQLPPARLFPTDARVESWLRSSSLTVTVADSADAFAEDFGVRIVARRHRDGRVEFALQQRDDNGSWGDRQYPTGRFFPTDARIDRWLVSSALTLNG